MTIFASTRLRNHSIERHSSRNFPLNDSLVPFCQGLPGSISAGSIFSRASHFRITRERDSEPSSERRYFGAPCTLMSLARISFHPSTAEAASHVDDQCLSCVLA